MLAEVKKCDGIGDGVGGSVSDSDDDGGGECNGRRGSAESATAATAAYCTVVAQGLLHSMNNSYSAMIVAFKKAITISNRSILVASYKM